MKKNTIITATEIENAEVEVIETQIVATAEAGRINVALDLATGAVEDATFTNHRGEEEGAILTEEARKMLYEEFRPRY